MLIRSLTRIALTLAVAMSCTCAFATCALDHSVFRDSANRGFTLEFSPATGDSAMVIAVAQLKHVRRGTILKFDVGQSNGYGSVFLERTGGADPQPHYAYFFDANLRESRSNAATWVFVSGLGAADYYETRQAPQVGDTLWKFERCKIHP
ncbi:MAG: hypothetical protein WAW73_02465 [Rhodoferax sp.]